LRHRPGRDVSPRARGSRARRLRAGIPPSGAGKADLLRAEIGAAGGSRVSDPGRAGPRKGDRVGADPLGLEPLQDRAYAGTDDLQDVRKRTSVEIELPVQGLQLLVSREVLGPSAREQQPRDLRDEK